ncbi:MAG: hypothetical protein KAT28_03335 [Candidatus Aenigmarchaeota archaeon]|nr:hypothetical protein [Candidatus Aenigmarchaeota archaeon]
MSKKSKEEKIVEKKEATKTKDTTETKDATETKKSTTKNILKVNYKVFAALLLVGGMAIGLLAGMLLNSCPALTQAMNSQEAGDKAVEFITTNLLGPGISAELVSIEELNGGSLYKLELNISDGSSSQVAESYITSDGEYIFPQGIITGEFAALKEAAEEQQNQQEEQEMEDMLKSDKPEVKLFIMSYCPYGLQAMKAAVPAYKLLDGKADMTINFVSYAMHDKKELDENLRMYCIQEEQKEVFLDYMACFTKTDDYESCLDEINVDKTKLDSCMARVDEEYKITEMYNDKSTWASGRFPMFNVEKEDNEAYGVRGSPTMVINGKVVSVNRSPEAYKKAICSAFETPPEECKETLSNSPASPGFGGGTGTASTDGCGS